MICNSKSANVFFLKKVFSYVEPTLVLYTYITTMKLEYLSSCSPSFKGVWWSLCCQLHISTFYPLAFLIRNSIHLLGLLFAFFGTLYWRGQRGASSFSLLAYPSKNEVASETFLVGRSRALYIAFQNEYQLGLFG